MLKKYIQIMTNVTILAKICCTFYVHILAKMETEDIHDTWIQVVVFVGICSHRSVFISHLVDAGQPHGVEPGHHESLADEHGGHYGDADHQPGLGAPGVHLGRVAQDHDGGLVRHQQGQHSGDGTQVAVGHDELPRGTLLAPAERVVHAYPQGDPQE